MYIYIISSDARRHKMSKTANRKKKKKAIRAQSEKASTKLRMRHTMTAGVWSSPSGSVLGSPVHGSIETEPSGAKRGVRGRGLAGKGWGACRTPLRSPCAVTTPTEMVVPPRSWKLGGLGRKHKVPVHAGEELLFAICSCSMQTRAARLPNCAESWFRTFLPPVHRAGITTLFIPSFALLGDLS